MPTPDDVKALIGTDKAFGNSVAAAMASRFDDTRTWVDPKGHTLSDRVWDARNGTRTQIDAILKEAVRTREDALVTAKKLEQYLNPAFSIKRGPTGKVLKGQPKGIVTTTPGRGGSGSYAARRLARTEISRANAQESTRVAQQTPFAVGEQWNLSAAHPGVDECNDFSEADNGLGPGVYPVGSMPRMPAHPHCLCYQTIVTPKNDEDIVKALRQQYGLETGEAISNTQALELPSDEQRRLARNEASRLSKQRARERAAGNAPTPAPAPELTPITKPANPGRVPLTEEEKRLARNEASRLSKQRARERAQSGVPEVPNTVPAPARNVRGKADLAKDSRGDYIVPDRETALKVLGESAPNATIDLTYFDDDMVQELAARFGRLADEYPHVAKTFTRIADETGLGDGTLASVTGNGELRFTRDYKSLAQFNDISAAGGRTKWTVGSDFRSVITHEYGHAVQQELFLRNPNGYFKYVSPDGGSLSQLTARFADSNRISQALSQYGQTSAEESWAELFASLYEASPSAEAVRLGKYLDWVDAHPPQYAFDLIEFQSDRIIALYEKQVSGWTLDGLINLPAGPWDDAARAAIEARKLEIINTTIEEGLRTGRALSAIEDDIYRATLKLDASVAEAAPIAEVTSTSGFVPAKTIDDAVEVARSFNVRIKNPDDFSLFQLNTVNEGLGNVSRLGYDLDGLVIDAGTTGAKGQAANASSNGIGSGRRITIRIDNKVWDSPASASRIMEEQFKQRWLVTDNIVGTIEHELGHTLHAEVVQGLQKVRAITDAEIRLLRKEVSHYASTDSLEAVAEIFSGMMRGNKYSDDIMRLYESLGGPTVERQAALVAERQRIEALVRQAEEKAAKILEQQKAAEIAKVAKPEWKPSMTRDEAEAFIKDSVYQDSVWHGTSSYNVDSILADGFKLDRQSWGRIWGDGVYATPDKNLARQYAKGFGNKSLEIKVNIERPLRISVDPNIQFKVRDVVIEHLPAAQRAEALALWEEVTIAVEKEVAAFEARLTSGKLKGKALKEAEAQFQTMQLLPYRGTRQIDAIMEKYNYDSLIIQSTEQAIDTVGGSQVMVRDPRRVVVVTS